MSQTDRSKLGLRVIAVIMVLTAVVWGAEVIRQALETDDGGPPLGAIGMAMPAFGLLIGAGITWRASGKP